MFIRLKTFPVHLYFPLFLFHSLFLSFFLSLAIIFLSKLHNTRPYTHFLPLFLSFPMIFHSLSHNVLFQSIYILLSTTFFLSNFRSQNTFMGSLSLSHSQSLSLSSSNHMHISHKLARTHASLIQLYLCHFTLPHPHLPALTLIFIPLLKYKHKIFIFYPFLFCKKMFFTNT